MFNYRKKSRTKWNEVRRKAPKVPDITCPNIDEVIKIVETHYENKKVLTVAATSRRV